MTNVTFQRLFKEFKESGLSVRDFCANQDIAVSTFYHWKKKQEDQIKTETPNEFIPLVIGGSELGNNNHQNRIPVICEDNVCHDEALEFIFPNGTKMLFKGKIDIPLLKTIVHLY